MSPRTDFYPVRYTFKHVKNIKQDIRLTGIRDVHFLKSEWENFKPEDSVSLKYLAFRGFWMCAILFVFLFPIVMDEMVTFYPIFLTNWSIMIQVLYSILFFIRVTIGYYSYRRKNCHVDAEGQVEVNQNNIVSENTSSRPILWVQNIIWFLQPICWVLPIVVALGFWVAVYKPNDYEGSALKLSATSMVHGVNAVLAIIDVAMIAIPVHWSHSVYVACCGLLYITFSGLYEVLNMHYPSHKDDKGSYKEDRSIYSILNWKDSPVAAFIASIVALLFSVFLFNLLYLAFGIRLLVVSFFKENTYEEHFYDKEGHHCSHCCAPDHDHDHSHENDSAHCGHPHDKKHGEACVKSAHNHEHRCTNCSAKNKNANNTNPPNVEEEVEMKDILGPSANVPEN